MSIKPSVTEALSPWSDFSGIREEVLEAAADRGKRVHSICAAMVQGLWVPKVPEDIAGYIESFRSWQEAALDKVLLSEAQLASTVYGYSGHPDLICRIRGDKHFTVVDFKTPIQTHRAWRPQLAGYWQLGAEELPTEEIKRVMTLRLKKDGSRPIINESTDTLTYDLQVFLNALSVWKYFNEK